MDNSIKIKQISSHKARQITISFKMTIFDNFDHISIDYCDTITKAKNISNISKKTLF